MSHQRYPTIKDLDQERFRLAREQMDRCMAAFHQSPSAPPRGSAWWLQSCSGYVDGRHCMRPVTIVAASVPLCGQHAEDLTRVITAAIEPREHPPAPAPAATPAPFGPAVVYYMGDPPAQLVKIGTTTRLRHRWNALRARKPELLLLAIEPGTYDVERRRHRQFRHLRVSGTKEWFRKVPQLMDHINRVRAEHGIFRGDVPPWAIAKPKPLIVSDPTRVANDG